MVAVLACSPHGVSVGAPDTRAAGLSVFEDGVGGGRPDYIGGLPSATHAYLWVVLLHRRHFEMAQNDFSKSSRMSSVDQVYTFLEFGRLGLEGILVR